jgi:NADPH:quinone reductase-like Zn-dependent oxidoreductase
MSETVPETIATSIHARAVRYSEFGSASVLTIVPIAVGAPAAGKVRIEVKAVGLNPVDNKIRRGDLPQFVPKFPAGIGRDMAGIIQAVGDDVTNFVLGDEVFGSVTGGALAEFVVAAATALSRKPAGVSFAQAASLPVAGQTAYDTVESLSIGAQDTVLVSAAAGGVGVIAAQLALRKGARVLGTASEANHEFLRSLGVVPVSYGAGLVDAIRQIAPEGITAVLDNHGAETIEAAIALAVPAERINTIAADAAAYGVNGVGRGAANPQILELLAGLVESGELSVPIEHSYPFDDVAAAYTRLEQGHLRGKIVVEL